MQRKEVFPYCLVFLFQLPLVVLTIAPNRPQAIAAPYYTTLETNLRNTFPEQICLASNYVLWHQKMEKTCWILNLHACSDSRGNIQITLYHTSP